MEKQKPDSNPFPKIEIVHIPEQLCRVGRWLGGLVRRNDYFQDHPFDTELYGKLGETHDGIEIREPSDFKDDLMIIGPNQMTFDYEEDG
jgi:hypothetical protein